MRNSKTTNVLIIPVNYNSYDSLELFLDSCKISYEQVKNNNIRLTINVADNSSNVETFNANLSDGIDFQITNLGNKGYLGGATAILSSVQNLSDYDYIIISNVDVTLQTNFFERLSSITVPEHIGWIAPEIWSQKENRDKNPKILERYSLKRLKTLALLYRFPILHRLYTATLYRRKKIRPKFSKQEIYAGHGSFMLFTKHATNVLCKMQYPVFLFGEECFISEKLKQNGLHVLYDPSLKIIDREHVSTGNLKSSFYYKCNLEAIQYLISEFYE